MFDDVALWCPYDSCAADLFSKSRQFNDPKSDDFN